MDTYFDRCILDSKGAKLQTEKLERQEQLLTLNEGFEKIKCAIKVSDIEVFTNHLSVCMVLRRLHILAFPVVEQTHTEL